MDQFYTSCFDSGVAIAIVVLCTFQITIRNKCTYEPACQQLNYPYSQVWSVVWPNIRSRLAMPLHMINGPNISTADRVIKLLQNPYVCLDALFEQHKKQSLLQILLANAWIDHLLKLISWLWREHQKSKNRFPQKTLLLQSTQLYDGFNQ